MSDIATQNELLGSTAYWTAAVRAGESAREDRLFNDAWATALAGPEGMAWLAQRTGDSVLPMVLRTRYFDDFLQQAAADEAVRQVVLMAAGLDTRAFRLPWPDGLQFFELDQAAILAYKEQVMQAAAHPACQRHTIAADLTAVWEPDLIAAGFDVTRPSVWLLEGFLFYLPTETLTTLLDRVMALTAPGSYIGFDIINNLTLTSPLTKNWVDMQAKSGAPWQGALDDPQEFLAARGWQTTLVGFGGAEANYGRWPFPSIPAAAPGMPHLWYVTAQKHRNK